MSKTLWSKRAEALATSFYDKLLIAKIMDHGGDVSIEFFGSACEIMTKRTQVQHTWGVTIIVKYGPYGSIDKIVIEPSLNEITSIIILGMNN